MFKIAYDGIALAATYATARLAWRGVHELLEDAYDFEDDGYGLELARYSVVAA